MLLISIVLLNCFVLCCQALQYENMFGELYGKEWLFMMDDQGYPHYVNLTVRPEDNFTSFNQLKSANVNFHLYTRQNREQSEQLEIFQNETVKSEYFDPANDLKVVTHGWMSSGDTVWILQMKDAYLQRSPTNFIAVDWSDYADNPLYPMAAYFTYYVGGKLAKMLNALANSYSFGGNKTHLIGHSLGAHVMGNAGSQVNEPVSRVTGLDPARPLFEVPLAPEKYRLDNGDANFVDIIHTCGGLLGYEYSHGDADFYPNGGSAAQPGCEGIQFILEACSHGRSYEFFTESIENNSSFLSQECESYKSYANGDCTDKVTNFMGEHLKTVAGDFYLNTNDKSKYSQS